MAPRLAQTPALLLACLLGCSSNGLGMGPGTGGGDDVPGGEPDAGTPEPDATEPVLPGEPITLPPDQMDRWVWIPIPEMRCGDNSPAGVGVRFTAASKNLVIWFQGNGVCYDLKSCTMFRDLLVGMGPDPLNHMWWGDPGQGDRGIFDRNDQTNPFRNDNFVVLPHCTVDGHTADKTSTYTGHPTYHQRGFKNATEALKRIAATFPDADRVVVSGFSAGGIGSTANYDKIATTFEALGRPTPFLIADSGPLLRDPYLSSVARADLRAGWGLQTTIEVPCPECGTAEGPSAAYRRLAARHPGLRSSILSSYADGVSSNLYRMLNYDPTVWDTEKFKRGLLDLATSIEELQSALAPSVHRVFYWPGDRHGALVFPLHETPGLVPFLEAQLSGAANWTSVKP